ncbi:aconitase X catalytic domain-containing protein [Temperatibacter marinus]|uniref:Aconitase X catalytic domain-containing protein n=1 Tax=Temperatibacter marinus TaxID=1456591 RepID=A0AA52EGW5_9PROT|nr:aconitase X catalytic domain-containing protein [Temperatibacter marinus]WND02928.1 aconitase X catalytic domain-containing protein [Temperatibacter marinus]
MDLTVEQQKILSGGEGPVLAKCLQTLVTYGRAFNAARLVPIKSAHLTGSFRISSFNGYYQLLEKIADAGLKVKVPTTLNPHPGFDFALQNRLVFKGQKHHETLMDRIGVTPNYSCVCYFDANVPDFGDTLGWAESSAIIYANSVIGARSNRNSVMVDICLALTGVAPEFGFLLQENRGGDLLIHLDIETMDAPALGYLLGKVCVERTPVIDSTYKFSAIELKNMGAAMASSGGVSLFHIVGQTPEAPTLEAAFQAQEPREILTITQNDINEVRASHRVQKESKAVAFGCPQMTLEEANHVAEYFVGKKVKKATLFHLMPDAYDRFAQSYLGIEVKKAGVKIYNHCPLAGMSLRIGIGKQQVLTNSAKLYYYLDGTKYGDLDDLLKICGVVDR